MEQVNADELTVFQSTPSQEGEPAAEIVEEGKNQFQSTPSQEGELC